jgi:hypothetical protein
MPNKHLLALKKTIWAKKEKKNPFGIWHIKISLAQTDLAHKS